MYSLKMKRIVFRFGRGLLLLIIVVMSLYLGGQVVLYQTSDLYSDLADEMIYTDALDRAAKMHRILQTVRDGETNKTIRVLEKLIDVSLIHISQYTNEPSKFGLGRSTTDWAALKEDRMLYPRNTSSDREERIVKVLNQLIDRDNTK